MLAKFIAELVIHVSERIKIKNNDGYVIVSLPAFFNLFLHDRLKFAPVIESSQLVMAGLLLQYVVLFQNKLFGCFIVFVCNIKPP